MFAGRGVWSNRHPILIYGDAGVCVIDRDDDGTPDFRVYRLTRPCAKGLESAFFPLAAADETVGAFTHNCTAISPWISVGCRVPQTTRGRLAPLPRCGLPHSILRCRKTRLSFPPIPTSIHVLRTMLSDLRSIRFDDNNSCTHPPSRVLAKNKLLVQRRQEYLGRCLV